MFADVYDPIQVASIDGLATEPHDRAAVRAANSKCHPNRSLASDPRKTLFVGRLHDETSEQTLEQKFSKFGTIRSTAIVRDVITGLSKCYAFVEFKHREAAKDAYHGLHHTVIDNCKILVDFEHGRILSGWKPRRLGGGFGGKKESGQLRFGCRERPFQRVNDKQDRSRSKGFQDPRPTKTPSRSE